MSINKFSRKQLVSLLAVATLPVAMPFPAAHAESAVTKALAEGTGSASLRYRYEVVDQENMTEDAEASTVRTRVGYKTGEVYGLTGYIEFEDVRVVGSERFNSTANGLTQYPVVVDVESTELNQGFLTYKAGAETTVVAGRQRIILDNARFVGNVGWRQNEQTFDALMISNKSLPDTEVKFAYLGNVNNIRALNADVKGTLLNVSYSGLSAGKLTGYGYMLDYENSTNDTQTLGVRFSGAQKAGDVKVLYTAEFATQSDYADAPATVDADYALLEAGVVAAGVTAKVGYEVLGGDGVYGFSTPLATGHAFNGWADKFLGTPVTGLQDTYVSVMGKVAGVKLLGVYHTYSADEGSADYGSEINLLAAKKLSKHYSVGVKYASYDADTVSVDTDKLWMWAQASF
jgi:hypothetical protein